VHHADRLLEGLDPEQREVATTLEGPVRVLAGAGTGKTRAITHRIAYGVASTAMVPSEVLAVTFTTRAASELRTRLAALGAHGVQARTFHSAALRQARYFWPQVFGGELPDLISSKIPLLAEAVRRHGMSTDQAGLRDLASEVEWAKVSNVTPEAYADLATADGRAIDLGSAAEVAKLFDAYEEVKRDRRQMDMEDALLYAAAVLDDDERVAATVRRQDQWLVVDEFQDVSPLQFRLLQLWLGGRDQVCVVGDPAQTIYTFAGASDRFLRDFPRTFPGTTSITLLRNYRSTPEVIEVANTVMSHQLGTSAVRLKAQRPAGAAVETRGFADEEDEATQIAAAIATAIAAGTDADRIAVLSRLNVQLDAVADALRDRGVTFTRPGQATAAERGATRQAMGLLRGAAVGRSSLSGDLVRDVSDIISTLGWAPTPPQGQEARRRWDTLQAVVVAAERFTHAHPDGDLAAFAADRQRSLDAGEASHGSGVTLTTLHAAKGLEWESVFLVGAQEGNMPFVYRDTISDIDEERRLFYVGVTRAQDSLHLSWTRARSPGGRATRRPTRFLDGLAGVDQQTEAAAVRPRRSKRRQAALSTCRVCSRPLTDSRERKLGRCEGCPSTYDETLYDELREWRRNQATEEEVPAYCVFTDATMMALAELLPRDPAALAKVPGIGPAKVQKYGDSVLAMCSQSFSRNPQ
jgi:DNA helicase-2/ATP-dependent DNA helicase PcrA